jgi:ferredoxin, 2Fe-2S
MGSTGVDRSRPRPPEAGPAAKRNCTAGRKGARKTASSHVARVVPADVDIEVLDGETLFDASWREGYDWPTVCIGQMLCTACHVIVKEGIENVEPVVEQQEASAIRRLARRIYNGDEAGLRLACQLRITGDVVVEQKVFNGKKMRYDAG